jgi:peptidoglycan hydrolase CwlO-like protein
VGDHHGTVTSYFKKSAGYLKIPALAVIFGLLIPMSAGATLQDDINAKQQLIQQLQQQIDQYQAQADQAGGQSKTLQNEIAKLNAQIGQINAQIRQLNASIDQTGLKIQETSAGITDAEKQIQRHQQALAAYLQDTYESDQKSLSEILLQNTSLSQFFDYLHQVQLTQAYLRQTIEQVRDMQAQLDDQKTSLESQQQDLQRMKALNEAQQSSLASAKGTKNTLLKQTQGQEAKYQQLVKQSKQDLQRIQAQITYLLQGGLTVEDAVKFAQLAAIGAGIRPAFLLALLDTESRLGQNMGSGNWRDDMYLCYQRLANFYPSKRSYYLGRAETEKSAYMAIIGKLGLDPDAQKVSKEPSYGCGGAMGPAQFIPSTWLGYEDGVSRITGHSPVNPWNFQDAFTASAIKLANAGATSQDRAGEVRAAKAYISGNGSCTSATCNSYANTIQQKAADIQQNL